MQSENLPTFETPATISIVGPSCSGKTTLALDIIEHEQELFSTPFKHYFWCIPAGSEPPQRINEKPEFQILYGVPDGSTLPHDSLVVLDDLQHEQSLNTQLLHTVHSHHRNLTVICLNHSIFPKNRFQRDLTQSVKYFIITKNPRDAQTFHRLALQLEPSRARELYKSYLDACSRPFGYLLCDLTQRAHPALRYRSCILPSDENLCIYASDADLSHLLRHDSRYGRFSEALHTARASASVGQEEEKGRHLGNAEQS